MTELTLKQLNNVRVDMAPCSIIVEEKRQFAVKIREINKIFNKIIMVN